MPEIEPILPPRLEEAIAQYYGDPQPDSAFAAHLQAQLTLRHSQLRASQAKPTQAFPGLPVFLPILRARPILAVLAAILALLALTGLVYALGRASGFIPGFGFTSATGQVYVLAEPVESTSGGITLRLQNAVSDDHRFWVEINVQGVTIKELRAQVYLQTLDGTLHKFQSGTERTTQMSFSFLALPPGTQELTLYVVDLQGQNFHLPIRLRPVKPGEILPVQPAEANPPPSNTQDGLRLVLDHVAPVADRTVFQVSLQFDRPTIQSRAPWLVMLTGERGQVYPVKEVQLSNAGQGDTKVFETLPFHSSETLAVSLVSFPYGNDLPVIENISSPAPSFRFDPGADPQIGQTWALNKTVQAGSHTLHVVGAKLTQESGLVFEFEPADDVIDVRLFIDDPRLRSSMGGTFVPGKNITVNLRFDPLPTQPVDVQITGIQYTLHGPWKIEWQPPVAPTPDAPRLTPTPTITPTDQRSTTAPSPSQPILTEIQGLAAKFDSEVQKGPGWVHVVQETHSIQQAGQSYAPQDKINEMWYEIDSEGYVTRSLYTDRSRTGQILQQAATVGNYSINFTYGNAGFNKGQRYRVSIKLWANSMNVPSDNKAEFSREETPCEKDNPCLVITERNRFDRPMQNTGEPQAYYGSGGRLWIDARTGQQFKTEVFWMLKDGKEMVTSTIRVVQIEKISNPPPEILAVLAKVIVPK